MTETTIEAPAATVYEPLTSHDACDACGYSENESVTLDKYVPITVARVRWELPSGKDLALCGHHSHEYELALLASGARIVTDQRDALLVKRPDSGV